MRLETAFLGQAPKVVATGFGALFDNAGYQVLACDEGSDRAIVGFFGQGLYAARLWVFRLSTGAIVRSVDYGGADVGRWVAASPDASLIAESVQSTATSPIKVTIRAADNGAALGAIDDFTVQGFSGNNAYVVGGNRSATSVIEWKSGHRVWSGTGAPYGGHLAEPAGERFAVGLGFTGGSDVRDVYLVGPGGSAVLLPTGVKVSLRY
jgi:hypothetical protein